MTFLQMTRTMPELGFDAKRACCNSSGLGNYARTLLSGLSASYPENSYHLFTPRNCGLFKPSEKNIQFHTANASRLPGWMWRSFKIPGLLKKNKIKLYHGLSHELPYGDCGKTKLVVTIHDLIPFIHPEFYPIAERFIYQKKIIHACKKADGIISISHKTAADLQEILNVPESKIRVIYQSCADEHFMGLPEINQKPNGVPESFFLYVGTVEERKDLMTLVRAMTLTDPGIPLIVAGKPTSYQEKVAAFAEKNLTPGQVIFLGKTSNEQLRYLYAHASFLVYPSRYEGWGLPVAEAMCHGLPVITTRDTPMEEMATGAGLFFNSGNYEELAYQIEKLMSDSGLMVKLGEQGKKIADQKFKTEISASETMNFYRHVLG